MPAASGTATTTARFAIRPAGEKLARPASRVRIGAASTTVARVEPISTPAATAASPPARAVVATDAISHGARPVTSTPSRSGPACTRRATAHDSAGSTVTPTRTAAATCRQAAARRRSACGSMVTAVAKTRTTSSALMPWRAASQARGRWTVRPMIAAARTAASSGYAPSAARARRGMRVIFPARPPVSTTRIIPNVSVLRSAAAQRIHRPLRATRPGRFPSWPPGC